MALAGTGALLAGSGCASDAEPQSEPQAAPVSIEVRYQGDAAAPQAQLAPSGFEDVTRILVDVSYFPSGVPFYLNIDLTKLGPTMWRGDIPLLPRNQPLRFAARAYNAGGERVFSGESIATLTASSSNIEIPLAPEQNGGTYALPRMFRVLYPTDIVAGQEEPLGFTVQGNAGLTFDYRITAAGSTTPAPEVFPNTGSLTLTGTVVDFTAIYTAPETPSDTTRDYQVTITTGSPGAISVATNFTTSIKQRLPGAAADSTRSSVRFNPVVTDLRANGSALPGTVELVAAVSDDSAPDQLSYQWTYLPNAGSPAATFAGDGTANPAMLDGYTLAHQGAIRVAVSDERGGTTTLNMAIGPNQFADAVSHAPADGVARLATGYDHTCIVTGEGKVRCWGNNSSGQLGYGSTLSVGNTPTRMPYHVGDVPLPEDPITHLPLDPVVQVAAGAAHTCALQASGFVRCWGNNSSGQLGLNSTSNLGDDEPAVQGGFVTLGELAVKIAAGGDSTCAILKTGALRCWGKNNYGQLGRGTTANLGDNEPVYSAGDIDLGVGLAVRDVSLGHTHACATFTDGNARCWGNSSSGQLGYGDVITRGDNEPVSAVANLSLGGPVRKVFANGNNSCALTAAGGVRCWGDGQWGQMGMIFGPYRVGGVNFGDQSGEVPSALPGNVALGGPTVDVVMGVDHVCALTVTSQMKCWGAGTNGQHGYGNTNSLGEPAADGVNLDGVSAYRVAAGKGFSCALRRDGSVRCWGLGTDGRTGRGSTNLTTTATGNVNVPIFAAP